MPVKRKSAPLDDPTFEEERIKVQAANELYEKMLAFDAEHSMPVKVPFTNAEESRAYHTAYLQYKRERAQALGDILETACGRCSTGKPKVCRGDFTALQGSEIKFKCFHCIIGKCSCECSEELRERHTEWQRRLQMFKGEGSAGRQWRVREAAYAERERASKQARIDKAAALADKRYDQV